ncbi:hypothetical protein GCM10023261_14600 [Bartonella jaculi]|uniref:Phage related protein n=2 Tax=Bartonella jaculi TaxID=686226 RepID=A0ABP9N8N4_9HYPH
MRAHEIGIYTILLNEMYARGRPLELSVERLARLCGCDKRTFANVLEMLIEEGKILNLANGLWNKRCENVFQERAKLLEQKSFAGRSSAQKRKKINARFQQLLNESTRDDKQISESQKGEEKETPYGVSEKKFYLLERERETTGEQEQGTTSADFYSVEPSSQDSSAQSSSAQSCASIPTKPAVVVPPSHSHSKETSAQISRRKTANLPPSSDAVESARSSSGKAKSRVASPKGQRLPNDWQADIGAAISEGLNEEQARWQEKKFRDYWRAKSGKEALKVDWQATWRNWFRREIERIKEHQARLAIFSAYPSKNSQPLAPQGNNTDALYRTLINYNTG